MANKQCEETLFPKDSRSPTWPYMSDPLGLGVVDEKCAYFVDDVKTAAGCMNACGMRKPICNGYNWEVGTDGVAKCRLTTQPVARSKCTDASCTPMNQGKFMWNGVVQPDGAPVYIPVQGTPNFIEPPVACKYPLWTECTLPKSMQASSGFSEAQSANIAAQVKCEDTKGCAGYVVDFANQWYSIFTTSQTKGRGIVDTTVATELPAPKHTTPTQEQVQKGADSNGVRNYMTYVMGEKVYGGYAATVNGNRVILPFDHKKKITLILEIVLPIIGGIGFVALMAYISHVLYKRSLAGRIESKLKKDEANDNIVKANTAGMGSLGRDLLAKSGSAFNMDDAFRNATPLPKSYA